MTEGARRSARDSVGLFKHTILRGLDRQNTDEWQGLEAQIHGTLGYRVIAEIGELHLYVTESKRAKTSIVKTRYP